MTRDPHRRRRVTVIVGPTAIGKTAVAVTAARDTGGEIVSADSRQIYRGMEIGTAKPTADERAAVPHHLVDIIEPGEAYDASRFARDAARAIDEIVERGREPFVVGGTGFYVASLFEGLFDGPGRNAAVREELEARLAVEGAPALHAELREVDPGTAARIHENDSARVVRALEVYRSTGRPLSAWHRRGRRRAGYEPDYFGLTMDRETLYARVDRRVDAMFEAGLVGEVEALVAAGRLGPEMPAATAVGYREILDAIESGEPVDDRVVDLVKRNTRRYAKRQITWFTAVAGVRWLDLATLGVDGAAAAIVEAVERRSERESS